jgi:hypothetical protein
MTTTSVCRSCGAPILWVRTTHARALPLNVDEDPEGIVTLRERAREADRFLGPLAVVHSVKNPPPAGVARYTSHFATCPNAARHRKSGARPAA